MLLTDYRLHSHTALITFANPPVNGLSHAVRVELAEALARAGADPEVHAIVLAGGGGRFSGGADIREFNTPKATEQPTLRQLIAQVETSAKPVVAAIAGVCFGGGLELALAAHYRVASADARLGLPEVKLGLIPGAGGTQRLPRLVGADRAISMITSGSPVAAAELAGTALLDRVVEGDPVPPALAFAASLEVREAPPRRTRDLILAEPELSAKCEAAGARVAAQSPHLPAPRRALEAIAAAAGPFETGLALERQAFLALLDSPESKALRYAFFSERAAGRVTGEGGAVAGRRIDRAAVIGAGTMGTGIAACFLEAGIPVTLIEADTAALERGVARITGILDTQVQKGRLDAGERERRRALLTPTLSLTDAAGAEIAIEAVFESLAVKREVFEALDQVLRPGAILASNTSSLDLNLIAGFTRRPEDVVGTHFFSPANVMRLLEVVRGAATAQEVVATALELGRRLGKVPVVSGVCDGFIGNRMLDPYFRQAWYLVEEGATPEQVDRAIQGFGMAMGPFRVGDLVGNDVSWAIRQRRRAERPGYRCSTLPDRLCELGRFGQKAWGGWYDYPEGPRQPVPSPVVANLISRQRADAGIAARPVTDAEIVERLVYALVNEGARILEEGIAARASDIDVVYLTGYGFPAFRGGPMYHADHQGLTAVRGRMREFAQVSHGDPEFWRPAGLLDRLADSGGTFTGIG